MKEFIKNFGGYNYRNQLLAMVSGCDISHWKIKNVISGQLPHWIGYEQECSPQSNWQLPAIFDLVTRMGSLEFDSFRDDHFTPHLYVVCEKNGYRLQPELIDARGNKYGGALCMTIQTETGSIIEKPCIFETYGGVNVMINNRIWMTGEIIKELLNETKRLLTNIGYPSDPHFVCYAPGEAQAIMQYYTGHN